MSRARRASLTFTCYASVGLIRVLFLITSALIFADCAGYVEPKHDIRNIDPWDSAYWWFYYNVSNDTSAEESSAESLTTILLATTPEETIDTLLNTTWEVNTSHETATEIVPVKKSSEKHKPKLMRMPSSNCKTYEDTQLYDMLADHGAYNQRFMANNAEEIAHRMSNDFKFRRDDDEGVSTENSQLNVQETNKIRSKRSRNLPCGWECQKIKGILMDDFEQKSKSKKMQLLPSVTALANKWFSHILYVKSICLSKMFKKAMLNRTTDGDNETNITHIFETLERKMILDPTSDAAESRTTSCKPEHFIPIGDCEGRGTEVASGYDRLCTECRGVYRMPSGCFPQFLNAVKCNDTDSSCIHDGWSNSAHGSCKEKRMSFTMMRNYGTQDCQDWKFESVQVPIACECFLNKSSWLRA